MRQPLLVLLLCGFFACTAVAEGAASSCNLVARESKKPCVHDQSFGCYAEPDGGVPRKMWVSGGCRESCSGSNPERAPLYHACR